MTDIPVVDSHIHLWPASEVSSHNWASQSNPIAKQRSVKEYREATSNAANLRGFIAIEADREHDLAAGEAGWEEPLAEVAWLRRIVEGKPRDGEGHDAGDGDLCLGIVPWAPLPSGPEVMARYIDKAKEVAGPEAWPRIRGFRYLLQDKPHGTGIEQPFIQSLKLLGKMGLVFDLGVDQHRRGKQQLEEALVMISLAHDNVPEEAQVTVIINHLCKPDLTVINTTDPSFIHWRTAVYALSKASNTYMKLSGGFAEMAPSLNTQSPEAIFEGIFPWLSVVLATFGPRRIMFASDWPVCTVRPSASKGGDSVTDDTSWDKWKALVDRMCYMTTMEPEDQAQLFGGTALRAYAIEF